eukprot:1891918-Alexandrium_andersonii.AAC.1
MPFLTHPAYPSPTGEELNIAYLPRSPERRRELKTHWLFTCCCGECREGVETSLDAQSEGLSRQKGDGRAAT